MVKILRVVAVLFLIAMPFFYAQAQSGYVEESVWSNVNTASGQASDFIITKNGTKLFGVIQRNFDYTEYDKVIFEASNGGNTYLPAELKAFGLDNGQFFMSKRLPDSSELEFVQILFSGNLQLDYKKGKYYIDNGLEIQELRAYYEDITVDGEKRRRSIKLYISILKILTSGTCGFEMQDLIEKSRLDEQDFIRILTQYHECEELPYKLHIEKIPFVKLSPTFSLGLGADFTSASNVPNKFNYAFTNSSRYVAFAGFRLHDFRKFPKSSLDLRIGYVMYSGTIDASIYKGNDLVTASQTFRENSIVIPFSYNYSFVKRKDFDLYLGLVLSGWFSSGITELGILELTATYKPGEIQLVEEKIMRVSTNKVFPSLKTGANFTISDKMKVFTELGVEFFKDYYNVQILASPLINLNRTYVSLQLGLEF